MLKRIGLLILTNIAIVVMLNVILSIVSVVFGINWGGMAGKSINLTSLSIYALIIGFTGSIFSLLTSKMIAKSTMGLQMIDIDNPSTNLEAWLVSTVRELANRAKLPMPEVAIYEGDPNAFATGPSRSSSLVAVSTGLLQLMNKKEVEAVLGHEMTHVANGDMVTMTLVQGVMNTFVVFLSRVIGASAASFCFTETWMLRVLRSTLVMTAETLSPTFSWVVASSTRSGEISEARR